MIPDALQDLGREVAAVWPLVVALGAAVSGYLALRRPVKAWLRSVEDEREAAQAARERDELAHGRIDGKLDTVVAMLGRHDAALTTLWETAPEALYVSGPDGRLDDCNTAYLRLWRFQTKDEARGDDWMHKLADGEAELARERVARVFAEPQVWTFDNNLRDGRRIRITGHPYYGDDGAFAGYVGAVIDLTDG
ncbi:MAG: PAS domain-containing protein [Phycisphaerales bacterium]